MAKKHHVVKTYKPRPVTKRRHRKVGRRHKRTVGPKDQPV